MATEKLNVIMVSGQREQLQMASMVAAVGAVSGSDVQVFVSMNALPFFRKGESSPAESEGRLGELMHQHNVPSFKLLVKQAAELGGAKIFPCSMAMDLLRLRQTELEPYFEEATGLTKFLADASSGQVWSF